MTYDEEKKIRNWLTSIGETNRSTIYETLDECRKDNDSLTYYLKRAAEVPPKKQAKPQRPPHRMMPPFEPVKRASQETRDAEMENIKKGLLCPQN